MKRGILPSKEVMSGLRFQQLIICMCHVRFGREIAIWVLECCKIGRLGDREIGNNPKHITLSKWERERDWREITEEFFSPINPLPPNMIKKRSPGKA